MTTDTQFQNQNLLKYKTFCCIVIIKVILTSQSLFRYSAFQETWIFFNSASTIPTTAKLFPLCLKLKCPQKEYLIIWGIYYAILRGLCWAELAHKTIIDIWPRSNVHSPDPISSTEDSKVTQYIPFSVLRLPDFCNLKDKRFLK